MSNQLLNMYITVEGRYKDLSSACETFPADETSRDPHAYKEALKQMKKGNTRLHFIFWCS